MTTIIIKENIESINDLPKIIFKNFSNESELYIQLCDITDRINELNTRKLIIELLNYKNIKDYITFINRNLYFTTFKFINAKAKEWKNCSWSELNVLKFNSKQYGLIDMFSDDCNKVEFNISTNITTSDYTYILYNPNINILHLILFHDLQISTVLIFLLYIYYSFNKKNRSNKLKELDNIINSINRGYNKPRYAMYDTLVFTNIIKYYCDEVFGYLNINNKPYIFDYSFDYEKLFLEGILPSISNNDIIQIIKNNKILTNEIVELKKNNTKLINDILELKDNNIKLTNEILELKENKKILIEESTEKQNLLEELNNSKDQNKLLTKVINKISDFENNNKILTDIIDDCNKN